MKDYRKIVYILTFMRRINHLQPRKHCFYLICIHWIKTTSMNRLAAVTLQLKPKNQGLVVQNYRCREITNAIS